MAGDEIVPRRSREPDNVRALKKLIDDLSKRVDELSKSASLRNASISGGDGLVVYDEDGNIRLRVATDAGAVVAYDSDEEEAARYGLLAHSSGAGQYGIETRNGSVWTHVVGATSIAWNDVSSKPSEFPPSAHTHGGGDITSAVPQAEGSQYGFDNTVGGSQFFAVWVGNNGGYKFGRNTSSAKYKENIRDFTMDASDLLQVRPVLYDYKPKFEPAVDPLTGEPAEGPEHMIPGARDQFGFIAEELAEIWPEVIVYYDSGDGNGPQIDGIRYDLVAARLVPILQGMLLAVRVARNKIQAQDAKISALEARILKLEQGG